VNGESRVDAITVGGKEGGLGSRFMCRKTAISRFTNCKKLAISRKLNTRS
jgi:hypothetical protein